MRLMYAAFLLMVSCFAHSQSALPKLYAVIFDVTVNSTGKVETLKVAKVIDPGTHTTDAVNVPVPDSYLTAAKALLITTAPTQRTSLRGCFTTQRARIARTSILNRAGRRALGGAQVH